MPSASKDTANTAARPRRPRGIPERIDHFSGGTPADTPWGDGAAGGCGAPRILGIGFEARGSMGGIPTDAARMLQWDKTKETWYIASGPGGAKL